MTMYAGESVTNPPSRVEYPHGVEYTCEAGYSSNGSPHGQTTLSARIDSAGVFTPTLPQECKLIQFVIHGQVTNAQNGGTMDGVHVKVDGQDVATVSSNGHFALEGVSTGSHKLTYEKEGFILSEKSINVVSDISSGGESDISMSPVM